VLLIPIPRCCAFSPMPPIGTSGVGLACNTEPIGGVTFRSILKSTIDASEAASIEDTRHKELLDLQTEPHLHQAWVSFTNLVLSMRTAPLSRKTEV